MEKRHAEQLNKPNLDEESRLEVIYRILKDQLRRAKSDLIIIKKSKQVRRDSALELRKRIQEAHERADKLKNVKIRERQNLKGENKLTVDDVDLSFKKVANYLLRTNIRKHNRYCPCCREYEESSNLNVDQMREYLDYIKQLHYKLAGEPAKPYKKDKPRD